MKRTPSTPGWGFTPLRKCALEATPPTNSRYRRESARGRSLPENSRRGCSRSSGEPSSKSRWSCKRSRGCCLRWEHESRMQDSECSRLPRKRRQGSGRNLTRQRAGRKSISRKSKRKLRWRPRKSTRTLLCSSWQSNQRKWKSTNSSRKTRSGGTSWSKNETCDLLENDRRKWKSWNERRGWQICREKRCSRDSLKDKRPRREDSIWLTRSE